MAGIKGPGKFGLSSVDGAPSFHLGMSLAKGVEVNPLAGNLHTFGCTSGGKLFFECARIDFIYK